MEHIIYFAYLKKIDLVLIKVCLCHLKQAHLKIKRLFKRLLLRDVYNMFFI